MENEPIRLAFNYLFPPGSSRSLLGFRGYDIDAFTSFERSINRTLEFVQMKSNSSTPYDQEHSPFDGILGEIENGTVLTNLDTNFLTHTRVKAFEAIISQVEAVELYGGISSPTEATSLQSFTVFAPSTLVLICATLIVLSVPFLRYGSSSLLIPNFLMLYGVFLIALHHGAFFQGNVSFPPHLPTRSLNEYLPELRTGKVGLVSRLDSIVKSDDRSFLLGHSKLIVELDVNKVSSMLCSTDQEYLVVLLSTDFAQLPKTSCEVYKVDPTVIVNGKLKKYDLFTAQYDAFMFPKNIPKSWMRKLRFLYSSLYGWENRLGFFYRKYSSITNIRESTTTVDKNTPTYSPFTLTRMASVLYVFAGLMAACCLSFVLEILSTLFLMSKIRMILPL